MMRFISSIASILAFGVAVPVCFATGVTQQIADSIHADDDLDFQDAAVLLQLEATKQSKVLEVKTAKDPQDRQHGSSSCAILASKPAATESMLPDAEPNDVTVASVQREPEQQQLEAIAADEKLADGAAQQNPGGVLSMVLRGVLQLAILAIIADGLRRYREQEKDSTSGAEIQTASAGKSSSSGNCAALLAAVRAGEFGEAHAQVKAGADVAADDIWGCTALHATASSTERIAPKFARLLLRQGAKVDARDAIDETPLFLAARAGNNEIIELLLEFGAEINAINLRGWTPLVAAAQEGHEHTCSFFLSRRAGAGDIAELQQRQSLPPLLIELLGLPELPSADVVAE